MLNVIPISLLKDPPILGKLSYCAKLSSQKREKTSYILDVGRVYGYTLKFGMEIGLGKAECLYV